MDVGRNNPPTKAETTHLKNGRNDQAQNDPDEKTEGRSDPDSVPVNSIRLTCGFAKVADNSFYRPALAILTVTDQNDSQLNVKTVLPIINTLILLENDQQLLSQSLK